MSWKRSASPNHAYEPEPYPLLRAADPFGDMTEWERSVMIDSQARRYGGTGHLAWADILRRYEPEERGR
jgi:hypothetical protein